MKVLRELHLEFTPYYTHYYFTMKAVHRDYQNNPKRLKFYEEKIKEMVNEKTKQVQDEVLQRFNIT